MEKKVRGSAFTTEEGVFTFTPYASRSGIEKEVIKSSNFGTVSFGKNTLSVRLSFQRNAIPSFSVWVEELAKMYNLVACENL